MLSIIAFCASSCMYFGFEVNSPNPVMFRWKHSNPQGRWWIKADACDVRKGLRESMHGTWSGDQDLGDGTLQRSYADYKDRWESCSWIWRMIWNFLLVLRLRLPIACNNNNIYFLILRNLTCQYMIDCA